MKFPDKQLLLEALRALGLSHYEAGDTIQCAGDIRFVKRDGAYVPLAPESKLTTLYAIRKEVSLATVKKVTRAMKGSVAPRVVVGNKIRLRVKV